MLKKNLSELFNIPNNKYKNDLIKNNRVKSSKKNNTSGNQSRIQSHSQILKEQEKQKKFKYLNQRVQIPTIYYDRVEYVKGLFNNEELGFIVAYAPPPKNTTAEELGKYFKQKLKNIVEIANGIIFYFYKTITINKNIFEKSIKRNSSKMLGEILNNQKKAPDDILRSGEINTSEESANLYREICGYAGVKIEIISGLIKNRDYKIGDTLLKHKWCIMNCGIEKYYFIDPLLSIGEINKKYEFIKELKPFYFLTPPMFFLENHFPYEEKYQFLAKPLKVTEFSRKNTIFTENFYNGIFKYKVTLKNRTTPEFNCQDSETVIKFIVDDMDLELELYLNGKILPKDNIKITNDKNIINDYIVTLIFPANGEYKLLILGKKKNTINEKIFELFSYKINVKITNIISHEEPKKKEAKKKITIPRFRVLSPLNPLSKQEKGDKKLNKCASDFGEKIKKKCYDNNNAHVFEPRSKILRIGQEARFRVRVRNAKSVAVLDGRKWNFLKKKDDDIFEGIITIKCESVVICALRNNNIYTEVFEFLAIKR
jgi:transglutaminase/protease-like cytokinesis protein 3